MRFGRPTASPRSLGLRASSTGGPGRPSWVTRLPDPPVLTLSGPSRPSRPTGVPRPASPMASGPEVLAGGPQGVPQVGQRGGPTEPSFRRSGMRAPQASPLRYCAMREPARAFLAEPRMGAPGPGGPLAPSSPEAHPRPSWSFCPSKSPHLATHGPLRAGVAQHDLLGHRGHHRRHLPERPGHQAEPVSSQVAESWQLS